MDIDRYHFSNMKKSFKETLSKKKAKLDEEMKAKLQSKKPVGNPEMQAEALETEKRKLEAEYDKKFIEIARNHEKDFWQDFGGSQKAAFEMMKETEKQKASYDNDEVKTPTLGRDFNATAEK